MTCSEFNQLLDRWIDGELDESQRAAMKEHAAQCSECREQLASAQQLRDILSHMDDDISVPLQAQAAWRKAVREEAKKSRMKGVYRAFAAVAAALVLMVGVSAMLKQNGAQLPGNVHRVETDGVVEASLPDEPVMKAAARGIPEYVERTIVSDDAQKTAEYLADVIAEYGAAVERETEDEGVKCVFVQVPGENAEDFISAVESLGEAQASGAASFDASAATVGVCIRITAS